MNQQAVVRKLARRVRSTARDAGPRHGSRNCLVASVAAGASVDGRSAVSITVGADTVPAPYLDSYTSPVVGDMVRVEFTDGSPLIHGRVVGLPSF